MATFTLQPDHIRSQENPRSPSASRFTKKVDTQRFAQRRNMETRSYQLQQTPAHNPSNQSSAEKIVDLFIWTVFGFSSQSTIDDDARTRTAIFLDALYRHDANLQLREAVDFILDHIDGLLLDSRFAECDLIFSMADIHRLSPSSIVSMLGITLAARDRLSMRSGFYRRAFTRIRSERGDDATSKLLSKYE